MKKFLLVGALIFLTGCSSIDSIIHNDTQKDPVAEDQSKKKTTTVCESGDDIIATFQAKGNHITQMKQVSHASYADMGIEVSDSMDKDAIQEALNQSLSEKYQTMAGVSVQGHLKDDRVEITIEINFEQADKDALVSAGLLDPAEKENHDVSLEKTIQVYQNNGFTCK